MLSGLFDLPWWGLVLVPLGMTHVTIVAITIYLHRHQAHRALDRLRLLRNRVAHHEPIFEQSLVEDYHRILDVAGWISADVRGWIERHSRVPALLDAVDGERDVDF